MWACEGDRHIAIQEEAGRGPCRIRSVAVCAHLDAGAGHAGDRLAQRAEELGNRGGWSALSLHRPAKKVVAFYNGRGTAEQWIKEGKNAVKWTRLSCAAFRANAVRLQLHALAYNLANFLRTLALPGEIERWSLTSLREKVVKIGAKVVAHGRYLVFQMAEVAVPRELSGASSIGSPGCAHPSWSDVDPRRTPASPSRRADVRPRYARRLRAGVGAAVARRVGSLATRIRSQRARNRLPDSPQVGYGPSGRGLRPVHLGNVGSEVFDAQTRSTGAG